MPVDGFPQDCERSITDEHHLIIAKGLHFSNSFRSKVIVESVDLDQGPVQLQLGHVVNPVVLAAQKKGIFDQSDMGTTSIEIIGGDAGRVLKWEDVEGVNGSHIKIVLIYSSLVGDCNDGLACEPVNFLLFFDLPVGLDGVDINLLVSADPKLAARLLQHPHSADSLGLFGVQADNLHKLVIYFLFLQPEDPPGVKEV